MLSTHNVNMLDLADEIESRLVTDQRIIEYTVSNVHFNKLMALFTVTCYV